MTIFPEKNVFGGKPHNSLWCGRRQCIREYSRGGLSEEGKEQFPALGEVRSMCECCAQFPKGVDSKTHKREYNFCSQCYGVISFVRPESPLCVVCEENRVHANRKGFFMRCYPCYYKNLTQIPMCINCCRKIVSRSPDGKFDPSANCKFCLTWSELTDTEDGLAKVKMLRENDLWVENHERQIQSEIGTLVMETKKKETIAEMMLSARLIERPLMNDLYLKILNLL